MADGTGGVNSRIGAGLPDSSDNSVPPLPPRSSMIGANSLQKAVDGLTNAVDGLGRAVGSGGRAGASYSNVLFGGGNGGSQPMGGGGPNNGGLGGHPVFGAGRSYVNTLLSPTTGGVPLANGGGLWQPGAGGPSQPMGSGKPNGQATSASSPIVPWSPMGGGVANNGGSPVINGAVVGRGQTTLVGNGGNWSSSYGAGSYRPFGGSLPPGGGGGGAGGNGGNYNMGGAGGWGSGYAGGGYRGFGGALPPGGIPVPGPTGAGAAAFGVARAGVGMMNASGQRRFGDYILMNQYGTSMAMLGNGSSQRAVSALFGSNATNPFVASTSVADAVTGGYNISKLGYTYNDPRFAAAMSGAAGMGYANAGLGVGATSSMLASMYSARGTMGFQSLGYGATLGVGGSKRSLTDILNGVLTNTMRGSTAIPNQTQMAAMLGQSGGLTVNLNALAQSGAISQSDVAAIQNYYSAEAKAGSSGMSSSQFGSLMDSAGRGNKQAMSTLAKLGIGTSDIQKLQNVNAGKATQTADLSSAYDKGLSTSTRLLGDFNKVLSNLLNSIPGAKSLIGQGTALSSILGPTIGRISGMAQGPLSGIFGGSTGSPSTPGGGMGAATGSAGGHTAADAVRIAEQYLGMPYQWGGSNPSTSFDCSGLTQWAYRQIGVTIPRTSQQQERAGQEVSKGQVRAGDLIFFGEPATHVGMSIGGGKMIEAPHTGANIEISSNRIGSASHVRRIVGAAGVLGSMPMGAGQSPNSSTQGSGNQSGTAGNLGGLGGGTGSIEEVDAILAGFAGGLGSGSGFGTNTAKANGSSTASTDSPAWNSASTIKNRNLAAQMIAKRGWTGAQASAFLWIGDHENSAWDPSVVNSIGATGIPQANPGNKMASAGPDWRTNPATQIRWMEDYIGQRYRDPIRAKEFWQAHKWYKDGSGSAGVVGDQMAVLHDGEIVLDRGQSDLVRAAMRSGALDASGRAFPGGNSPQVTNTAPGKNSVVSSGGGVSLNFNAGSIVIHAGNSMTVNEARAAAQQVVSYIAADKRLTAIRSA